jgi:hypothetical protein
MNTGKWGVAILLAAFLGSGFRSANPATVAGVVSAPDQQAQPQAAQQSSDQTQGQKKDQKQEDPLAEASRRAREQKKQQPKAAKVWDNDNIPSTPGSISVVGEPSGPGETTEKTISEKTESQPSTGTAASSETNASSQNSGQASTDEERKAELRKELAQAKEHLESISTDLDILSRKYVLDQQTFYGKTDYSSDTEGAVKLKVEESQIASKKQEVADAQKQVDDLTAKLKELEGEPAKPTGSSQ